MIKYFILIVLGYLLGSIPFSYLTSKYIGKIDIRKHGSGNSGTTNVFRTLGKKAAFIAFIGDFSKGLIATIIGGFIFGTNGAFLCGLSSVIGHCYPFTLNFKGGKGVATSAGVIFAISPIIGFILLFFQIIIIATTKYMSLASSLSAILFPFLGILFNKSITFIIYSIIFSLFVLYKHRANISRLLSGKENKLKFKKNS
ncbi:glycerol-3-phosphate 1-O-acyltransferase PlsY [Helicovermis profundi]|uniref:Glycerol-3-phosphate acyltransferase n=1 Tax=Helicovermis profundi TaxID=3065157 RepID=A0AAU9E6G9_9FIRM|nr:glycerol-3-phosphate 1-O-acyltransferase PlsY [Clostridia bacterium S502]